MASPSSSLIESNPTFSIISAISSSRQSSDLHSDLLIAIFSCLSILDKIPGVSSVCSSWRAAAKDPHCWRMQILDLSDWESVTARIPVRVTFNKMFDHVLSFVRDCEIIEEVYFPFVANGQDLILVANRLPNLLYFSISNPRILELDVCLSISKFTSLRGMAIHVLLISKYVLHSIAKFPYLSELKLLNKDMIFLDDKIVWIIPILFPELRKLEMPNVSVSDHAFRWLLNIGLKKLEYVQIYGRNTSRLIKK